MIRSALLSAALLAATTLHSYASCDDRFISTCDVRSWHSHNNKSEFRLKRHSRRTKSDAVRLLYASHKRTRELARGDTQIVPHPAGCPSRAFCGCGTAVKIFGAPIRSLWLAANWFRFPRAEPAPGMVAVRQHHVFAILRVIDSRHVLAYDANSGGHLTRIHPVSLQGYSVRNPHPRA